jgi:hypothetical protein
MNMTPERFGAISDALRMARIDLEGSRLELAALSVSGAWSPCYDPDHGFEWAGFDYETQTWLAAMDREDGTFTLTED